MTDSRVLELTRREAVTIVNWFPFVTSEHVTDLDKSFARQLIKAVQTSGSDVRPDSIWLDIKVSQLALSWYDHLVDGLIDPRDVETHEKIESFLAEITQGGE